MPEEKNTKFCSNCGAEIDKKAKICLKCGVEQPIIPVKVSNWWYLAVIFLGVVGGLIAWVVNKDLNPKKAKKLLIIGIVLPIAYIIAYLGIIALLVSVSLEGAREKAKDARIMSDLSQIRNVAQIVYSREGGNYSKVSCAHPEIVSLCQSIKTQGREEPTIRSAQNEYCAYAKLLSEDYYYCIDSELNARKTPIYPGGTKYCNGITFVCP